jgi:exonuclease III
MKVQIANWNMAYWQHRQLHGEAWHYFLNHIGADIFLFQEGRPAKSMMNQKRHLVWSEIGGKRDWGSGVYSPRRDLKEESIETLFKGVFSIGNTKINNKQLTLISLYGLMESNGPTKGYSITNLHRILSDLTGLLNGHIGGKRNFILCGDLNASTQCDEIQKDNSHKILFDRIEDFGLKDVYKLSNNKRHVQTLRHPRSRTPWQNDYCFVSDSLVNSFVKYDIIDNDEVRIFSDHNVVTTEMNL